MEPSRKLETQAGVAVVRLEGPALIFRCARNDAASQGGRCTFSSTRRVAVDDGRATAVRAAY